MNGIDGITIIGTGLMGGSMGLGLKRAGYGGCITGYGSSAGTLEEARRLGAVDRIAPSCREAVRDADLVVIAAPLGYYESILRDMAPWLKKGAVVTDIGSVKGYVMDAARALLPEGTVFVGGHPMAGSEKNGIQAASPLLYENAYYFLCPRPDTPPAAVELLKTVVAMLKAYPVVIEAGAHDQIVAKISHLPHIAAASIVQVLENDGELSHMTFAGGGFRDTTRIASGKPDIWKDILTYNRQAVLRYVERLEDKLGEFRQLLENGNGDGLYEFFSRSKAVRDQLPAKVRGSIDRLYEISISVEDRPGSLGKLTCLMGDHDVNIKEIEVLHSRDGEEGAIRLAFDSAAFAEKAMALLEKERFKVTYYRGE